MITDYKQDTKKGETKFITGIVIFCLFSFWLCTPPGNKFLQVCLWGNNTRMLISKLKHEDTKEYIFYRNNAILIAKMYPKDKRKAIKEMDKAIAKLPSFAPESELLSLYSERAQINMFLGNYQQALNDYLRAGNIGFNDYLKIAMLYKELGNYREAISYCNAIINAEDANYSGFACLADVYETAGRPDISMRVWRLSIDRGKNLGKSYLSRALLKKRLGDTAGYEEDLAKAKTYLTTVDENESIINDTLHPKSLELSAR